MAKIIPPKTPDPTVVGYMVVNSITGASPFVMDEGNHTATFKGMTSPPPGATTGVGLNITNPGNTVSLLSYGLSGATHQFALTQNDTPRITFDQNTQLSLQPMGGSVNIGATGTTANLFVNGKATIIGDATTASLDVQQSLTVTGESGASANQLVVTESLSVSGASAASLNAGTGIINVSDASASSLNVGTGTITVNSANAKTLNSGTGTITVSDASAASLNAGTGTITVNSATAKTLNSGTGTITVSGASAATLDAGAGTITVNSATAKTLNSGTGTITVSGASAASLDAGTGTITVNSATAKTLNSGTGTITVSGASAASLNAGTGTIDVSGATAGSLNAGSLTINGTATISGAMSVNATAVGGTASLNLGPSAQMQAASSGELTFVQGGTATTLNDFLKLDGSGNLSLHGNIKLGNTATISPSSSGISINGNVTATGFNGSGSELTGIPIANLTGTFTAAQLPNIPADKITGTLTATQLPDIPAGQITGTLTSAQIPSLVNRNVLFYAPTPVINIGNQAEVKWQADTSYVLELKYINSDGQLVSLGSANGGITAGTGKHSVPIIQSTMFTLTATSGETCIAQHQVRVDVIPTINQKAAELFHQQNSIQQTINVLAPLFGLTTLTTENVATLAKALHLATYSNQDIFQYIPGYYSPGGKPKFTSADMSAMYSAVG